jgi:hypothetical protein
MDDPPPTSGDISGDKKKKEEERFGHWGWPRSTPTARGRDPATLSGPICLSDEPAKKKKKRR